MKVLKFGAVWCPGCLVMRPIWGEIEKEMPDLATEYHDYDTDKEAVEKYNVSNTLPVFIFLDKNGQELVRVGGEPTKQELIKIIQENIDK